MAARQTRIDRVGFRRLLRDRRALYAIVSLGEGNLPLYASQSGARYAGVDRMSYLHLGMNPTGSFEDLGMTVAISAARTQGAGSVVWA